MDYFSGHVPSENGLSLTDMIESDIKSEFNDGEVITTLAGFPILSNGHDIHDILDRENIFRDNHSAMEVDKNSSTLVDLSWLQAHGLTALLQPENNDPNLLVNPKTGLPITQSQPLSVSVNSNVASNGHDGGTVTVVNKPADVVSGIHSQDNTAQYVTTMQALSSPSPTRIAPKQSFFNQTDLSSSIQNMHSPNMHSPRHDIQNHNTNIVNLNNYQQQGTLTTQLLSNNNAKKNLNNGSFDQESNPYPKPVYSYSCLIAMALKNSDTGALPVSEIYSFMTENFPYFKTAPDGWKNSVRHNLSLNKCFEKIENPKANGNTRKGCLWGLNPLKIEKMDEEIAKWRKKDPVAIKRSMAKPEVLEMLEKGNIGSHSPRHPNNVLGQPKVLRKGAVAKLPNGHFPTTINVTATTVTAPGPNDLSPTPISTSTNHQQVNVIEVKPDYLQVKNEPSVKSEDHEGSAILSDGDLNMLDNSLTLDHHLSDTLLQNGIWDELSTEGINLDELTSGTFNVSFNGLTTSPATVPTSVLSYPNTTSPLISLLTSSGASMVNGNQLGTPTNLSNIRTISAHT